MKTKRSFFEKMGVSERYDDFSQQQAPQTPIYSEEEETVMRTNSIPTSYYEETSSAADAEGQLTIDVYQTEGEIVIKSTIAGVKPEDLDVSINNDMVTIRGERRNEEEVAAENYYYQECYWGQFSRSIVLPVDIITEKSEAALKNGILTIRLPKAETNRVKRIQVRGF